MNKVKVGFIAALIMSAPLAAKGLATHPKVDNTVLLAQHQQATNNVQAVQNNTQVKSQKDQATAEGQQSIYVINESGILISSGVAKGTGHQVLGDLSKYVKIPADATITSITYDGVRYSLQDIEDLVFTPNANGLIVVNVSMPKTNDVHVTMGGVQIGFSTSYKIEQTADSTIINVPKGLNTNLKVTGVNINGVMFTGNQVDSSTPGKIIVKAKMPTTPADINYFNIYVTRK